ncbi:HD domain-containing protein [Sphaerisporangium sp. TRM90804]|uniref:RelA/SpoT family protein n=1 Tax=Sphaerisporangium sp. TRM90804 TaxID=3031113 RepID=UPI00244873CF|nr:HD domain-containing protein [Sphaerisporangium sp. TRM90804]MDH2426650.1 HD domain-containing protein [Sphaerisporangium sp. TRM90804]
MGDERLPGSYDRPLWDVGPTAGWSSGTAGLGPVLRAHRAGYPKARTGPVRRAYEAAERAHRGQSRKSGEPYITHPLAVTLILAELGMDTATLQAALLHDTVEDTDYTIGELRADFGDEIALLVDGVTKLDGSKWGERAEAETFRKMVLAAAADLRVLLIKLADRLHNLRTLGFQPPHKQRRIARQSQELLIPFAERLGMYELKREMDDLCFSVLRPEAHAATEVALAAHEAEARALLEPVVVRLREALVEQRLSGEVVLHRRHLWAVHLDVGDRLDTLQPADLFRLMVLIDGEDRDCYIALGSVHAIMKPVPGRLKDFISLPRFNLYRALHTRVIAEGGKVMDVIIRTRHMHRMAERGLAAHIHDVAHGRRDGFEGRIDLEWLRRLLAWQNDATSADFLESLRGDLRPEGVAAFTTDGEVILLPPGATSLDFAYALGPQIGDHAIGSMVNGRLVPLHAPVDNGAVVQILTAETARPSADGLAAVVTPTARLQIRRHLAAQRAGDAAAQGRRMVAEAVAAAAGVDLLDLESRGISGSVAEHMGFTDLDDLYAAVGKGTVDLAGLVAAITAENA